VSRSLRRGGQVVEDLDLERLPPSDEEGAALIERDFIANERVVRGDGRAHSASTDARSSGVRGRGNKKS